ncbi:MAG TPA: acetyl-CoA carboxylase biotin carboxyl carrier protein subunit, partial [Polyangiales bacterium]
RYLRAVYDVTDAYIRVEVEGSTHRFGRQTAGQVRAGAPSMVVSIDVKPGDKVKAGQMLGMVEAMKMEIGFSAPVAGNVTEVRVGKGQQVAAGDVLLVIEPVREAGAEAASAGSRLRLPDEYDPLSVLFDASKVKPDLRAADGASPEKRQLAMAAVNEEIRRILLGFDMAESRFNKLLAFLEAPVPEGLSAAFLSELSQVRSQLAVFVAVEQLFSRARPVADGGMLGPSNSARFRAYLRRMRSQGAGIAQDFLDLLKDALKIYGVSGLEQSEDLEKSIFRMFATQRNPEPRRRLVMAILRRVLALLDRGADVSQDDELRATLMRVASLRDMVSNALADNALEANYRIFQRPALAQVEEETARRLESWLTDAEAQSAAASPPAAVMIELSAAPCSLFTRVLDWLHEPDRHRRAIAVSALLRRVYAPKQPSAHVTEPVNHNTLDRMQFVDGLVLGAFATPDELPKAARSLLDLARASKAHALELIVPIKSESQREGLIAAAEKSIDPPLPAARMTLTLVSPDGALHHETFKAGAAGIERLALHGLHPETAERIDLGRYVNFELERLWGGDDVYCFFAKAKQDEND